MIGLPFVVRALDNGVDAVGAVSDDLVVRYWNAALARVSGIATHEAIGQPLEHIAPRLRGDPLEEALHAALSGDSVVGAPPFLLVDDRAQAHAHEWFVHPLAQAGVVRGAAFVGRSMIGRAVATEQVAEAELRFRALADNSPVLLWMAGTDSLCTFFNQTWLDFTGRTLQQEYGVGWLEGVHPVDLERCMTVYMSAFSKRQRFEMEYRLRRHDGEYRWLLDRGAPRKTPSGDFVGYVGSCVDITERKAAEDAARELAAELGRANKHMETLLYSASHDLNEPIRTVRLSAQRLADRLATSIDDKSRTLLGYVQDGATRMTGLVDGLLGLAKVRERVLDSQHVDMDALLADVATGFREQIADGATLAIAPLPPVRGDAVLLRSLFTSLLSNGFKFHRPGSKPSVRVSATRHGTDVTLVVADDGIGFDARFADKLFTMFGRLHSREDYPGSGVGLALASDITARHRGKIWAESTPGEGSRFFVTLTAG